MIKRFNPDFSLSISHELAYMRETPEGGYVAQGDYATLFSELELVKADRDAQQKRADSLAVESAELKADRAMLAEYWIADGGDEECAKSYCEDTPATSAAIAAIEARGAVTAIENLISRKERSLAEMHPDTHAYGATQAAVRNQIYDLELFATELREAK